MIHVRKCGSSFSQVWGMGFRGVSGADCIGRMETTGVLRGTSATEVGDKLSFRV